MEHSRTGELIRWVGLALLAGCAAAPKTSSAAPVGPDRTLSDGTVRRPNDKGGVDRDPPAQEVQIQNLLARCMGVDVDGVRRDRNVVLGDATLRPAKSIGECGCKSAALAYRSTRVVQGREHVLAEGELNTLRLPASPTRMTLVLATDGAATNAHRWTIVVSCEGPE